jgi:hypothetical protein
MVQAERRREAADAQPHNNTFVGNEVSTSAVPTTYPPSQNIAHKPSLKTNWSRRKGNSSRSSSVDSLHTKNEANDVQTNDARTD